MFFGGIRQTVFGNPNFLTKHSLVFLDSKVKPLDPSVHWHRNARVADFTCVLFHYKFLDEHFRKQAVQAVQEEQYHNNSIAYKKYLEVLVRNPSLQLKQETAKEIKSTSELVENLFLVVSEDYMMLVYDEERKGVGHVQQGEPGRPEDEAFDRARAKAKVQSLRARRFKRQVEELREENRRLIEEHQERIEKLKSRLEREREKLKSRLEREREKNRRLIEKHQERVEKLKSRLAREREKNRDLNLTRQEQSTWTSWSFELLNRLGRVRAKMLGRKR